MIAETEKETGAHLKTLWTVLLLSILLAAAQAYLTTNLTDFVMRAQGHSEKPVATGDEKRTSELDELSRPIDLEVQSVNEIEALNAGSMSRFESGN